VVSPSAILTYICHRGHREHRDFYKYAMKTLQEFKEFYQDALLPKLKVLESQRTKRVLETRILIFFAFLGSIICVLGAFYIPDDMAIPLLAVLIFIWIAYFIVRKIIKSSYKPEFKKNIIAPTVKFIDDALEYEPHRYINETDFIRSHLFTVSHDTYLGDDYVSGKTGHTSIEFSEIYSAFNYGRGGTYVAFKGLFFLADFNKNFIGRTIVLPDKAEKILGRLGRKFQKKQRSWGQRVDLENIVFEKHFVVYSDDQVIARYILSPNLMDRIVKFVETAKRKMYLSFIDSKVYIAIPYRYDQFEPRLFNNLLDFNLLRSYFEQLQLLTGVIEDLNLNTRIWTKE